ncbi:helix-turn-helix domain-containing protein [Paenibacillus harenae]|uniref:helix-turn-helix domain-containing protein n=1 Tax=Paenibacillus harenae TaxID=306543 RepID=UPI0003FFB490|nr:helix-turn-helix transcriptional regulator [Paenibacillus harenae]
MNNIEKMIKELRTKRGWSQDDLAERMGMTRANISNYERGLNKNIPSETLKKFADVFGVSSDYLLGKSENSDRPESEFLKKLELSDGEILKQFTLVLDGKTLTEEEARFAIAVLRTNRQMKG